MHKGSGNYPHVMMSCSTAGKFRMNSEVSHLSFNQNGVHADPRTSAGIVRCYLAWAIVWPISGLVRIGNGTGTRSPSASGVPGLIFWCECTRCVQILINGVRMRPSRTDNTFSG